jgi:hypothetical protein
MTPSTAYKLWHVLDAVTRDQRYCDYLSVGEWMEVSKHLAGLIPRCAHCGELITDPLQHPCPRSEPAIIV